MYSSVKKGLIYLAWLLGIMLVGLVLLAGSFLLFADKQKYRDPLARAKTPSDEKATPEVLIDKENHLIYNGRISQESFNVLKALYDKATVKPSLLIINSPGGAGMVGLQMGFWVRDGGLSVEVPQLCASACANFVFPAGKQKLLDRRAMIIWHGGAHQSDMFDQIDNVLYGFERHLPYQAHFSREASCKDEDLLSDCRKQIEQNLYVAKFAESLFYYELGIDHNLPYYGQQPRYTATMDVKKYGGFYYAADDMRRMGLSGIRLNDKWWEPETSKYFDRVYKVKPIPTHNRTDADLGMAAFLEILRDYQATHKQRYSRTGLLNWYINQTMTDVKTGNGHAPASP